ncbi:MAG: hypothetical protein WC471_04325 [Candidatus Woesearchaeota archaeon]
MKAGIKYYLAWFCIYLPIAMSYKYLVRDEITTLLGIIVIALAVIPVFLAVFKDRPRLDLNYSRPGEFNVPAPVMRTAIKVMGWDK